MNTPLVTVYIPTYNRIELLQRAVNSVLNQTYANFEIIIVDDCSTDGTQNYLEKLSSNNPRINFFTKDKNSGACTSRNIAINNAVGEFITGLDDDDYFIEDRLYNFINQWDDNYSCLFTYNYIKNTSLTNNKRLAMKKIVYKDDLLKANHIGNQIFTRTKYLKNVGGFDKEMLVWQDLECWYRLLSLAPGKRLDKCNYVVDISHPHERITNKSGEKVKKTFNYFTKKHDLNYRQILNLETQLANYRGIDLPLKVYIRKWFNFKSFGNIFLILRYLFK